MLKIKILLYYTLLQMTLAFKKENWFQFFITLCTIAGNYFLGSDIASMSDRYELLITPSSPTFAIWGIIYAMLCCSSFMDNGLNLVLYTTSAVLNCGWVYCFTSDRLIVSSVVLVMLNMLLWILSTNKKSYLTNFTFGIYATWTFGAALLNIGSLIVKTQGVDWSSYILFAYSMFPLILLLLYVECNISCFLTILWTSLGIMSKGLILEAMYPMVITLIIMLKSKHKIPFHNPSETTTASITSTTSTEPNLSSTAPTVGILLV